MFNCQVDQEGTITHEPAYSMEPVDSEPMQLEVEGKFLLYLRRMHYGIQILFFYVIDLKFL